MQDLDQSTPTRTGFMEATQRCAAAYHRVMANMPRDPVYRVREEIRHKAFLAFAAELPVLCDPQSFQLYIACIGQENRLESAQPSPSPLTQTNSLSKG